MRKVFEMLIRKTPGDRFKVGETYFGTVANGFFSTMNDEYEQVVCHLKEFRKDGDER